MIPCSSEAPTVKVSLRPSTAVKTAVAVIVAPTFEGLMCEQFISDPTVVEPSGRASATAVMAAFSIKATIAGVAKTSKSPEPIARAVFVAFTTTFEVADKPFSNILFLCYIPFNYYLCRDKGRKKMRNWLIATLLLLLLAGDATAQRRAAKHSTRGIRQSGWAVMGSDSTLQVDILPVYVFNKKADLRRYRRLVDAVKKVYPLAQIAKQKMHEMEGELLRLSKKEQRKYIKQCYKQILDEYTPVAKRMTRTQGRVLVKLIDRETDYTAYEVIREFRGGFVASFWQGIGRIFGHNLKSEYDKENEDRVLEQIVLYYEAGLL